jgi:hypothetical protein
VAICGESRRISLRQEKGSKNKKLVQIKKTTTAADLVVREMEMRQARAYLLDVMYDAALHRAVS